MHLSFLNQRSTQDNHLLNSESIQALLIIIYKEYRTLKDTHSGNAV